MLIKAVRFAYLKRRGWAQGQQTAEEAASNNPQEEHPMAVMKCVCVCGGGWRDLRGSHGGLMPGRRQPPPHESECGQRLLSGGHPDRLTCPWIATRQGHDPPHTPRPPAADSNHWMGGPGGSVTDWKVRGQVCRPPLLWAARFSVYVDQMPLYKATLIFETTGAGVKGLAQKTNTEITVPTLGFEPATFQSNSTSLPSH